MSSGESGFESLKIDLNVQHLEKLGEGGMGVVLRVNDHRLNRDAALKILKSDVSNEEMERRFLREAKITAQLDHPSIPPVYEIGHTSGGDLFLLMRVIEGETLQKKIRRYHDEDKSPKALRELLDGLLKVSQAVAYAHSQNIVHRDLKPQNIMVGQFGEVMVMDWGLGKDLSNQESDDFLDDKTKNLTEIEEGEGLTQVGSVMGTLGYMPPEQAGGEAIDQRADIFALGAILTEILTREVPIAGKTNTNKMVATIKGEIRSPHDLDSTVPGELNAIAMEALAADAEDRMGETNEFIENLSAYLAGREVPVYNYSPAEKVTRQAQKRPGLLLGLPIVLTLFMTILVLGLQLSAAEETAEQQSKDLKEKETELSETLDKAKENEEALEKNKTKLKVKEEVEELFREAKVQAEQGRSFRRIEAKLQKALKLCKRDYDKLLAAAEIYQIGKFIDSAKEILEEASEAKNPHEALFRLHVIEVEKKKNLGLSSEYLERLTSLKSTNKQDKIYTLFATAHKQLQRSDYDGAIDACDRILRENKGLAIVYFIRGLSKIKKRKLRGAEEDFQAVLKLKPQSPNGYFFRGLCYQNSARQMYRDSRGRLSAQQRGSFLKLYERAKIDYKRCLDLFRTHTGALLGLAETDFELLEGTTRNLEQIRQQLDKATLIDRDLYPAYRLRAKINERLEDYEGAIKDYLLAIKLNPLDYDAYYDLGDPYKQLGKDYEAYKCYQKSYEIRPSFFNGRYYKIKADHESKGLIPRISDEQKLDELNIALKMKKSNTKLRSYRARLYSSLGRFKDALKDYDILIRSKKPKAEYFFEMAKIYLSIGEKKAAEKAAKKAAKKSSKYKNRWRDELERRAQFEKKTLEIATLKKTLKGTKDDVKTLNKIAKIWKDQKRYKDVVQVLSSAVKLDPKSSKLFLELGKYQLELHDYDEAIQSFTQSIKNKEKSREAFLKRGRAYHSLHKYKEAVADYSRAIKRGYEKDKARLRRARANFELRDYESALDDLNREIQAKPNCREAFELRASVYREMVDDRCLSDFRRAIELDESKWKIQRDYGFALYELSEYRSAMKVMKQLREKYRKNFSGRDESNTLRCFLSARSKLKEYRPK